MKNLHVNDKWEKLLSLYLFAVIYFDLFLLKNRKKKYRYYTLVHGDNLPKTVEFYKIARHNVITFYLQRF